MKKLLLFAAVMGFTTLSYTASAQDEQQEVKERKEIKEKKELKEKKETQEIVIRKKGDSDSKITVEIKGDNVTINGKPISEFKDADITINKRNIRIWDGQRNFSFAPNDMEVFLKGPLNGSLAGANKAFLGVTTNANSNDLKATKKDGAEITNVAKGSAAEKAGLKNGDIITKINSTTIDGPETLSETIGKFKPTDAITIYYKREGKEKSAKAVLGESKSNMSFSFTSPKVNMRSFSMPPPPIAPDVPMWNEDAMQPLERMKELQGFEMFPRQQKLGIKIQDIEEGNGVKILDTDKDSPAEKAGLKKDDIVTEIGGKKINNTDEAREELMENATKNLYTIKAKRNGSEMNFEIKIPKKLKTANL